MKNDNKGRDIFYGIVAIATLIVAIIGATLAYFSVTASSNEGAVNAQAAVVSIEYSDGQQVTAQATQLIPATLDVVQQVYEANVKNADIKDELLVNECIDKNNRQVCSAYRFSVRSDDARSVVATLNSEHNGFSYLSYALYDVTAGEWVKLRDDGAYDLSLKPCSNENEETEDDCFAPEPKKYNKNAVNSIFGYKLENSNTVNNSVIIGGMYEEDKTKTYELVLFIKENNDNQNIDQGQEYHGTIIVDVLDGGLGGNGNITGCVGDDCIEN